MSREIKIGIGCFLGGAALSILLWVVDPKTIPYSVRFALVVTAIALLLVAAYMIFKACRSTTFHHDRPFIRSTGQVWSDEDEDGPYTTIIERDFQDPKIATRTSVFTNKAGSQFIVDQHVQQKDGSTKTVRPPKD
ncbi:MAG: BCD family MFS transporter [Nitrospira sp.]|nr:MAG: BCD family MFS transporter [Nitrospira sp.]